MISSSEPIAVRRSSANFVGDLFQLGFHDFPKPGFRSEDLADVFGLGPFLFELFQDPIDFQGRDAIQGQLEHRVGLLGIERKGLHQPGRRVGFALAGADDLQGLFEPFEDDREAFEDVNPPLELPQLVLEPPRDGFEAEIEKVPQAGP